MKTNAARILDAEGVAYQILTYTIKDDFDAVTAAEVMGLQPEIVYKTLVVQGDRTGPIVALIPSNQQLNMKALCTASGNKSAAMYPLNQIQALTGYIRGGVSPLGMKKKLPTYIHDAALLHQEIGISGGKKGVEILLSPTDLSKVTQATACSIVTAT